MKVRIIGNNIPNGLMSGELIELDDLINYSEEQELDLIECGENNNIKLYKITDIRKEEYDRKKKEKQNKNKLVQKEIKLKSNIDDFDLNRKFNQIVEFYQKGYQTNVSVTIRRVKITDIPNKELEIKNKFNNLFTKLNKDFNLTFTIIKKWIGDDQIEKCDGNISVIIKK